MTDVKVANTNVVGNWRMPVLGDLNERAISATGLDGFPVE